jgi:hypothetical protein
MYALLSEGHYGLKQPFFAPKMPEYEPFGYTSRLGHVACSCGVIALICKELEGSGED